MSIMSLSLGSRKYFFTSQISVLPALGSSLQLSSRLGIWLWAGGTHLLPRYSLCMEFRKSSSIKLQGSLNPLVQMLAFRELFRTRLIHISQTEDRQWIWRWAAQDTAIRLCCHSPVHFTPRSWFSSWSWSVASSKTFSWSKIAWDVDARNGNQVVVVVWLIWNFVHREKKTIFS